MREAKTRSPKFSSRISIASLAWIVRVSTSVGQDALDLDVRIQVLADHLQGVLQLDQPAHRQILALHGDDHLVGRRQRVDREQPEARRRVDADEVVVLQDRLERLLQRALAADLRRHRDLGAGEVDRGAGDVDLALADDLADRDVVHEHVVHRLLERVGVDALRHRQVALRVHVDAQHAMALLREGDGEVQRRRRLGDAALLVGERDDPGSAGVGLHWCSIASGLPGITASFAAPRASPSRAGSDTSGSGRPGPGYPGPAASVGPGSGSGSPRRPRARAMRATASSSRADGGPAPTHA